MKKPVLLSGIQPSGHLMIGNYVGVIKHWVDLQDQYDSLFMLADLHTITVKQDPADLRSRCFDFLALYIACGLDPEKNTFFVQSHVYEHAQLTWLLNCFTYMGELNRMTQFKDKSAKNITNINAGLFDYPVLMAADILLYQTNLVPVGHDQKQHLELARDLAIRINNTYGEIFTIPEPYIPPVGGRIMGLQDPSKKMSKSDSNEKNYLALLDTEEEIRKKIKRAVTDLGTDIKLDESKPGISNLLTLYSLMTHTTISDLETKYQQKGYGEFKNDLAEVMVDFLKPIQEKFYKLRQNETLLMNIVRNGASAARLRANDTLIKMQDAIGLIPKTQNINEVYQ